MPNHRLLATTDDHSSEEDDAGHGSSTKDFGLSVVILALAFGLLAKALPVQAKQNLGLNMDQLVNVLSACGSLQLYQVEQMEHGPI